MLPKKKYKIFGWSIWCKYENTRILLEYWHLIGMFTYLGKIVWMLRLQLIDDLLNLSRTQLIPTCGNPLSSGWRTEILKKYYTNIELYMSYYRNVTDTLLEYYSLDLCSFGFCMCVRQVWTLLFGWLYLKINGDLLLWDIHNNDGKIPTSWCLWITLLMITFDANDDEE